MTEIVIAILIILVIGDIVVNLKILRELNEQQERINKEIEELDK